MRVIYILLLVGLSGHLQGEELGGIYRDLYSGKYEAVIQKVEELLPTDSVNIELYSLLGHAYRSLGNSRSAIAQYSKIYALDSLDMANVNALAKLLVNKGASEEAEILLTTALETDSTNIGINKALAKLYYADARYGKAFDQYSDLVVLQPDIANIYHMRARCAVKMDYISQAYADYEMAHSFDLTNTVIIYEYCQYLYSKGDLELAQNLAERGLSLQTNSWKLSRLMGHIYFKQRDYVSAIKSYTPGLAHGDQSVDLMKKMGYCFYEIGAYPRAIGYFQQAMAKEANDPATYYYLALCEKRRHHNDEAVKYFSKSLSCMQPQYLEQLYINMAQCYIDLNDPVSAIQSYRKALPVSDKKASIHYLLANVYSDYYKDKSVALAHYRIAAESPISPQIDEYIQHKISELIKFNHFHNGN